MTESSPDAGECVEQVGCRVAPVVEHLVKREDVVVDAVVGEISVFDATKGDGPLCFGQLLWGQDLQKDNQLIHLETPALT